MLKNLNQKSSNMALLSKPPRTAAEAKAQVEALVKRDRKMLERLAKL
jgi:hypothetical protein